VEIKKILLSTAIVLIAMGVSFSQGSLAQQGTPPNIKVSLALTDSQQSYLPDLVYNWDDPIRMVITLENKEEMNVITTKGFPQRPFHLLLIFTGPDGKTILTHDPGDIAAGDAPPPIVIPVQDQLKQVEPVESLAGSQAPWVLSVEVPDAHAYYTLTKAGNYSVKALIPMRTYHRISYPGPPEDYSEIIGDDFKWSGALQSNTVHFALLSPPLDHITISPDTATIIVGGNQSYTAEGYGGVNNDNSLGDVTSETTFMISPDGSCAGATCTATLAGIHTVTGSIGDKTDTATLQVVYYGFSGFLSPVNNPPVFNTVKAGQAIPVKFSLYGNQGLDIFSADYPMSVKVDCDTSAPQETVEDTVTAGSSGLSYDLASDRYTYVWKTNKSWANTCRKLTIILKDGIEKSANFKFTR
jgi:hypothetical protein